MTYGATDRPLAVEPITAEQASIVTNMDEGQFSDVKAAAISPSKLGHTISALANTDGGDLYVGIGEELIGGGAKRREWRGFTDVEAANGHIQSLERLFAVGKDFHYEFLRCDSLPGVVLHIQISRTQEIMKAADGHPYVRRGAQNLPVTAADQLRRLEYSKGVTTFESHPVDAPIDVIVTSPITANYLKHVVPNAEPERWLQKQKLIREERPTVAGLLLFSEEPQAQLPKLCGIKVYRYKTQETEGFRDVLAFHPITVEGCIYEQIKEAVAVTIRETEKIPRVGADSLEPIRYPAETLHEIITNAVIHRDYSIADDIHIRIFDNRVEVQSPGRLPAHVTVKNILDERFARNGAVVRLLNKFPDPPNRDVGEGLNTAFEKMNQLGLKAPSIEERDNDVLITVRHEPLASPEEAIIKYLEDHDTIKNKTARAITHVKEDYRMKKILSTMADKGMLEPVPGKRYGGMAYRKKRKD